MNVARCMTAIPYDVGCLQSPNRHMSSAVPPPRSIDAPTLAGPRANTLATALARSRIPGMDALRVGAVLAVMMGHAGVIQWSFGLKVLLVFSGFLITRMLLDEHDRTGTIDLPRFAWRRATRLMPALWLYTTLGALYLGVRDKPVPWAAMLSVMGQVHNYHQGVTGGEPHYLSHTWSLSLQEQFYMLCPLCLLWAWRRGLRLEWALCGWIACVWGVRAIEHLVFHLPDAYLYRALETRSDNLAVGALLAVLMRQKRWTELFDRLHKVAPFLVIGLGLCVQQSMRQGSTDMSYRYVIGLAIEPLLIAVAVPLFIVVASSPAWIGRVLNAPVLRSAGQGSYAMYLSHQILMHACFHLLTRRGWATWPAFAVAALLVGAVGVASFTCFETPVREWLDARAAPWFKPTRLGD